MVTNLWEFLYPIGYIGKFELWPIKARNEDAATHRSDMGPLGPMALVCAIPH